ncbi:MAG: ribonuclease P protein component [Gallionellales bacterium CG_4_9_14_0_8_um_filter_55_61]|nr:MAG: ribonuclease P protein component [Gallionellales bacterium CG_4_9_14_0_8_um_filter_55_61]
MISDNYFKIFFVPNNLQLARLGIVAAKKLMPRAVDRNLAKREIRQLFRVHKIKFVAIDIVVMVRKTEPLDKAAKTNSLSKLFSRVVTRCAES